MEFLLVLEWLEWLVISYKSCNVWKFKFDESFKKMSAGKQKLFYTSSVSNTPLFLY